MYMPGQITLPRCPLSDYRVYMLVSSLIIIGWRQSFGFLECHVDVVGHITPTVNLELHKPRRHWENLDWYEFSEHQIWSITDETQVEPRLFVIFISFPLKTQGTEGSHPCEDSPVGRPQLHHFDAARVQNPASVYVLGLMTSSVRTRP